MGMNHSKDISSQLIELPGNGRTIPTYAFGYEPHNQKPAIIIVHDIFGSTRPLFHEVARQLAQSGFAVLLPDLFVREGALAEETREAAYARYSTFNISGAVEDLRGISNALASEGRDVGMIGFCMGGTLGFFTASRIENVKACVIYYGFPVNAHPSTYQPDSPIDEIEQLHMPILGFFGEEDAGVGTENVYTYEERAKQAGKTIDFTVYPHLGHAWFTFEQDQPASKVSQETWARVTPFFQQNLH
jgi:carboxymethylenebutenolidase